MILLPFIINPPLLPGIKILLIVFRTKVEAGGTYTTCTRIDVAFRHNSTVFIHVVQTKPRPVFTGVY